MNVNAPGDFARGPTTAERLLLVVVALAFVHHVDHVLRWDHSGWPFKPLVTPFTYSLLLYPILGAVFALRRQPWVRVALMGLVFVLVQFAHIYFETPYQQYDTWASGFSHFPYANRHPNLLHIASPVAGVLAAALSIALSVAMIAALAAFIAEARDSGERPIAG